MGCSQGYSEIWDNLENSNGVGVSNSAQSSLVQRQSYSLLVESSCCEGEDDSSRWRYLQLDKMLFYVEVQKRGWRVPTPASHPVAHRTG